MAKINPVKLKQDADKEEKAGRFERAILLYRQIVDENPRDWNTINKIGDLYAKLNRTKDAADEYAKVADFYARDGFLLKSIAIWKKINKLDTTALDPYLNLADLYSKQGLMMEAKSQYQIVVDEYVKRGKVRDAGEVLKKMADIDPGDLKIRSKLADLYTRDGNTAKAVDEHVAIAEELNKKGHLAEALQVLEKGLKLDPRSNRLRGELARIHLVQKNWDKAAVFLEEAVQLSPNDAQILARLGEAYVGGKKLEEAEAIYKRVLELDPKDDDSRAQMAKVFLLQGQYDRAYEDMVPLVERLMERREGDRAVALLQQVVQRNPSHIKTLLKLADLYRMQQKDAAVTQTYSQLTEAYINQGQLEQAVSVLEMLVNREPSNGQYKTKLDFVRGKLATARPVSPVSVEPEIAEEDFDLSEPVEAEPYTADKAAAAAGSARPAGPSPARPVIEASGPLSDEDKEFIEEHLAEGKVFRKYGLVDKAADQFEAIAARFPDNVEARQELREIHREKGSLARAAEQCLALAEIARLKGDMAAAEQHEEEARRLAPELVAAAAPGSPAAAVEPEVAVAVADEFPLEDEEQEIDLEVEEEVDEEEVPLLAAEEEVELGEEEEVSLDEEEVSLGPALDEPTRSAPAEEPPQFIGVDEEEPELAGEEFALDEDVAAETPLDAVEPDASPLEELSAPPLEEPIDEPGPESEIGDLLDSAPPVDQPPSAPAELQRVLDEVESYVALGFVDDARDALREVSARYPGHPAIQARAQELGLDQEPAPVPEPAVSEEEPELSLDMSLDMEEAAGADEMAEASPSLDQELGVEEPALAAGAPATAESLLGGDGFEPTGQIPVEEGLDLGDALGDLFATQSAVEEDAAEESSSTDLGDTGLAEIFKEFKKGVDRQLSKEDYDTRYNLGIAYKEMGLLDEAIAEFQLAAKDDARLLECSSMLGICFMEKGMPKLAVKWFEKGLAAEGRSEEEYLGLRYDLAQAHEASGELEQALGIFTDLYGQNANFRDVASKVRDLRATLG